MLFDMNSVEHHISHYMLSRISPLKCKCKYGTESFGWDDFSSKTYVEMYFRKRVSEATSS